MNFFYLSGMGYGLHATGDPVVGISIFNILVIHTFVDDLDLMESDLFC